MKTKELIEKQRILIGFLIDSIENGFDYKVDTQIVNDAQEEISALEAAIAKEKDVAKTETDTGKLVDLPDFNQPLLKPISFEKDEPLPQPKMSAEDILYDFTGMVWENHISVIEAMEAYANQFKH